MRLILFRKTTEVEERVVILIFFSFAALVLIGVEIFAGPEVLLSHEKIDFLNGTKSFVESQDWSNGSSWQPPIGIPYPSFGINETNAMYSGQIYQAGNFAYLDAGNGAYSHYVDNTKDCTDTNNLYGNVSRPRCTVPTNLPEGSVVEIHGGPYSFTLGGRTQFTGSGTASKPIIIRGVNGKPIFTRETEILGTYIIVENLDFDTSDGVYVSAPSDHISIRHSVKRDGTGMYGAAMSARGGDSAVHDLVFWDNDVHDNGNWNYGPEQPDQDYHGYQLGYNSYNVWFLDSRMWHNSGDGIQINANEGNKAFIHHVYVGRNTAWENRQTGFWIKQASDVIFSQNIAFNHTVIGYNSGMGWQYEHDRIWYLYNEIYGNIKGIGPGSGEGETYLIGNVIHDNSDYGFLAWANDRMYLVGNTFYRNGGGISVETSAAAYLVDNIISNNTQPTAYHISVSDIHSQNYSAQNNLLYQPNSGAKIYWDANAGNVSQFQASYAISGRIGNNLEANPLFASSSDYSIRENSPARNAGIASEVYQTFYQDYGINIAKDFNGLTRPQESLWDMGAYEYSAGTISCSDGIQNGDESGIDCGGSCSACANENPAGNNDAGNGGGSSGGSSNQGNGERQNSTDNRNNLSGMAGCQESWECGAWSECLNGEQTRSCQDVNNCNTIFYRPELSQDCVNEGIQTINAAGYGPIFVGAVVIILAVIAVVFFVLGKQSIRRRKS